MKYKALFFDIDDTIFDFGKCSKSALFNAFSEFGIECSDNNYFRFKNIDDELWNKQKQGNMSVQDVLNTRFELLFKNLEQKADYKKFQICFENNLCYECVEIKGAKETIKELSKSYKIYAASNGILKMQKTRLEKSKLIDYFEDLFVSDEIGYDKPDLKFFETCLNRAELKKSDVLMIGDSINADITGAKNCNIDTCWYNPNNKICPQNINPDYIIDDLRLLNEIIKSKSLI